MPMPQPDYRIHEMNKRLQQRTDDSDNLWWDAFATEFFEDDANLTLTFCLEDGPKRYSKKTYYITLKPYLLMGSVIQATGTAEFEDEFKIGSSMKADDTIVVTKHTVHVGHSNRKEC